MLKFCNLYSYQYQKIYSNPENYYVMNCPAAELTGYYASDFHNLNEASFEEFNPIAHACLRADTLRQKNLCNLRNLWIKIQNELRSSCCNAESLSEF